MFKVYLDLNSMLGPVMHTIHLKLINFAEIYPQYLKLKFIFSALQLSTFFVYGAFQCMCMLLVMKFTTLRLYGQFTISFFRIYLKLKKTLKLKHEVFNQTIFFLQNF